MVRLFTGKSSWSLSLATSSYACAMPTCRPTVFLSGKGTNSRGKTIFAKLSLNTDPEPAGSSGCPRIGKNHAQTGSRDAHRVGGSPTPPQDNPAEPLAAPAPDSHEPLPAPPQPTHPCHTPQ